MLISGQCQSVFSCSENIKHFRLKQVLEMLDLFPSHFPLYMHLRLSDLFEHYHSFLYPLVSFSFKIAFFHNLSSLSLSFGTQLTIKLSSGYSKCDFFLIKLVFYSPLLFNYNSVITYVLICSGLSP